MKLVAHVLFAVTSVGLSVYAHRRARIVFRAAFASALCVARVHVHALRQSASATLTCALTVELVRWIVALAGRPAAIATSSSIATRT